MFRIVFPVILGIMVLGIIGYSQDVYAQTHNAATITQLSNDIGSHVRDLDMVSEGDNIYLIWSGNEDSVGQGLLFTKSTNGGQTFDSPSLLPFSYFDTSLHISGSTLYLLGTEYDSDMDINLLSLHKSIDNGQSFSETIVATDDTGSGFTDPKVVSSNGIFYVVWTHYESPDVGPDSEIPRMAISTNNGFSFGSPIDLSSSNIAWIEDLVSVNGDVFVLWSENDDGDHQKLYFQEIDDGVIINQKVEIPTSANFHSADLTVVETEVIVSFTESTHPIDSKIYTTKSTSKISFETPKLLLDSNERNFQFRGKDSVTSNQNNVGIWWYGFDPNTPQNAARVWFANSEDAGDAYSTKILQDSPNQSFFGDIQFKSDTVFVVWGENTGQGQSGTENIVTLAISPDSGNSFDTPLEIHRTLFTTSNISIRTHYPPTIMDVQDDLYIAWENPISGDTRDDEVFFALVDLCNPPSNGDWVITKNCLLVESVVAPGNVTVQGNSVVTVFDNVTFVITSGNYVEVQSGSGILLMEGANLEVSS